MAFVHILASKQAIAPKPCMICDLNCRAYRGLYIVNWIYRSFTEDNYRQWIGLLHVLSCFVFIATAHFHHACVLNLMCAAVWISGLVQTGLYADFFYYYFKSWQNNEKLSLPT